MGVMSDQKDNMLTCYTGSGINVQSLFNPTAAKQAQLVKCPRKFKTLILYVYLSLCQTMTQEFMLTPSNRNAHSAISPEIRKCANSPIIYGFLAVMPDAHLPDSTGRKSTVLQPKSIFHVSKPGLACLVSCRRVARSGLMNFFID